MKIKNSKKIKIPILPLKEIIIYPNMIMPLFIGKKKSIKCVKSSMKKNKKIFLVTEKISSIKKKKKYFSVGTFSNILQMLKLPDGTLKILIEGLQRASLISIKKNNKYLFGKIKLIKTKSNEKNKKQKILIRTLISQFQTYISYNKKIPVEILSSVKNIKNHEKIVDTITIHMPLKIKYKKFILKNKNIIKRIKKLMIQIESEIKLLKIEKNIRKKIKNKIENSQKEYYLNEQIKELKKELNKIKKKSSKKFIKNNKIKSLQAPKNIKKKIQLEIEKLKIINSQSSEYYVIKNYIEWMIKVPWNKKSKIEKNILKAKKILNYDHYGINDIKERILEYLSVQNRSKKTIKGPILCLIGPPGVGKTSLGKSIAKATGRKYIKFSLGGIKDESEIRGHRRTYIGSMPGTLMQKIIKSKVKNPLILLDEIDKMSYEIGSNASSALLEVLDPEQNYSFNDHYLEIDYDLSDIMFIATANSNNIPIPLLDRMEIIELSGYTEEEKLKISQNYLIPKKIKENALKKYELKISKKSIMKIINNYTKESGVRSLEKEISKICRKVVKILSIKKKIKKISVNTKNLKKYLGISKYYYNEKDDKNYIGQVNGLAWTGTGGDLLTIESICIKGTGELKNTGYLGKIMKESILAAITLIRSKAKILKIPKDFYKNNDIHIHVPEGATPKDGPSAGISVCISIISSLTKIPVKSKIAMTGEITLCGKILQIGGLKEKLLAARRSGIKEVLIPFKNKKELLEIPKNITKKLIIHPIKNLDDALKLSLKKIYKKK
ncbi:endopeptidase La [Buchnera aphidicola]|uniref:endopeptidase La n=1 Tax=Buchnera aphidicola TaxID=9 RepID=UPI003463B381